MWNSTLKLPTELESLVDTESFEMDPWVPSKMTKALVL